MYSWTSEYFFFYVYRERVVISSFNTCECMFTSLYLMRVCCMNMCAVLDVNRLQLFVLGQKKRKKLEPCDFLITNVSFGVGVPCLI